MLFSWEDLRIEFMMLFIDNEYYFDEDSLFRDLPQSAQDSVGDRLMPDEAWKQVADEFRFSPIEIQTIAAMHMPNCARKMLSQWSRRSGATLRVLTRTLDKLKRKDIVTFLDDLRKRKYKCIYHSVSIYLCSEWTIIATRYRVVVRALDREIAGSIPMRHAFACDFAWNVVHIGLLLYRVAPKN